MFKNITDHTDMTFLGVNKEITPQG